MMPQQIFSRKLRFLVLLTGLCCFQAAQAVVIARYNYEGDYSNTSFDSNFLDSATDLTVNLNDGGLNTGFVNDDATGDGTQSRRMNAININNGTSATGDNFEFTLTPTSGGVQYDVINWYVKADNDHGSSSQYSFDSKLYVSTDGFTTVLADSTIVSPQADAGTVSSWLQGSLDLSGFGTITDATTFRVIISDGSSSNQKNPMVDNITVNAVPEPATAALLLGGFSAVAIIFLRLRRK